nr:immunoglobulin light chain junction region [Macaca mulatta]
CGAGHGTGSSFVYVF